MTESMIYVAGALGGYLVGGFPTGVVLSKGRYRIDVREMGSGNIGATNVTRVFGWYAGVLTFIIDFLKGFLPILLVTHYFDTRPWLVTTVGVFCVVGHCFSPFLSFRGGKGVATSFGCLTVLVPWMAAVGALAYVIVVSVSKISAVGSLSGLLVALTYLAVERPAMPITVLVLAHIVVILIQHRSNISRLIGGTGLSTQSGSDLPSGESKNE